MTRRNRRKSSISTSECRFLSTLEISTGYRCLCLSKSGGEATPSSPSSPATFPTPAPALPSLHSIASTHRAGVDSPDRFVTPYSAPPALSQRHLLEALSKADIQGREHEDGDRDNIRGDPSTWRVDDATLRNMDTTPRAAHGVHGGHARTTSHPQLHPAHHSYHARQGQSASQTGRTLRVEQRNQRGLSPTRSKAFAFFGRVRGNPNEKALTYVQDDSGSDLSDPSEET